MNAQRLWYGAVALATVAMAAWLLGQLVPPLSKPHPPTSGVDYRASGITLTQMRTNGKPRYRLQATTLTHTLPDDITHLQDVVLTVYPQTGAPVILTTPRADLQADGEHVHMPERVVITRSATDGELKLVTSDLYVNIRTQTATSQAHTTIDAPGYHVQGLGLHADFADHVFELLREVRSTYQR
ncbi:MAG: LPS export ABC transporter periplasmic protein LptC [Acidihalobacter sp.]|uniref:LPS export ABC transporter periplasmic protein LptC n=1 Tax=Acidihalobacter sp. TaxID=1872108 RepID=UPI00307D633C